MGVSAKNAGRLIKYSRSCCPYNRAGLQGVRTKTNMKGDHNMSEIAKEAQTTTEFEQLKNRLKTTWMTGDYDLFSRYLEKDAERFYQRLGVTPGTRLLDVGCGAGQLALIAARTGAQVTGCDISTNWLEKAQARAAAEGLEITF